MDIGYANVPYGQEDCSGDGWIQWHHQQTTRILLVDAMGHGRKANDVCEFIKKQFLWICQRSKKLNSIADCLRDIHQQLDPQKMQWQAAAGLVDIDTTTGRIEALVIGNIQINTFDQAQHSSVPALRGMLGGRMPDTTPLTVLQSGTNRDGLMSIHSDGVRTTAAREFLGALRSGSSFEHLSAQAIAEEVITRFGKTTDDASCLIVRWGQAA